MRTPFRSAPFDDMPPPQQPHLIKPEKTRLGARAFCTVAGVALWRRLFLMACAAFHVASSVMRRCGTSTILYWSFGLGRDRRLRVTGSFTIRTLFQTMRPA